MPTRPQYNFRVRVQNAHTSGGLEDYLELPYDRNLSDGDFTVWFETKKEVDDFVKYVKEESQFIGGEKYSDQNTVITVKPITHRKPSVKKAHTVKEHQRYFYRPGEGSYLTTVKSHERKG